MARVSAFLTFSAILLAFLVLFAEAKPYGFDLSSSEVSWTFLRKFECFCISGRQHVSGCKSADGKMDAIWVRIGVRYDVIILIFTENDHHKLNG